MAYRRARRDRAGSPNPRNRELRLAHDKKILTCEREHQPAIGGRRDPRSKRHLTQLPRAVGTRVAKQAAWRSCSSLVSLTLAACAVLARFGKRTPKPRLLDDSQRARSTGAVSLDQRGHPRADAASQPVHLERRRDGRLADPRSRQTPLACDERRRYSVRAACHRTTAAGEALEVGPERRASGVVGAHLRASLAYHRASAARKLARDRGTTAPNHSRRTGCTGAPAGSWLVPHATSATNAEQRAMRDRTDGTLTPRQRAAAGSSRQHRCGTLVAMTVTTTRLAARDRRAASADRPRRVAVASRRTDPRRGDRRARARLSPRRHRADLPERGRRRRRREGEPRRRARRCS